MNDDRLFSDVIGQVLTIEGLEPAGRVAGVDALAAVRSLAPDVVLIDLGVADPDALEVGRLITQEAPGTKVVALAAPRDGRGAHEAVQAGFHGYITKNVSLSQFVASIRAASAGQVVILVPENGTGNGNGASTHGAREAAFLAEQLSPREKELLALLVDGASSGQIAEQLSVSPNTVRTHIQSILTKLQVHSRLEAAAFAFKHGIVKASAAEHA